MGILLTWDRESQAPLPLSSDALTIASMKLTESPEVFSLILVDETGQESVQDNYSAEVIFQFSFPFHILVKVKR